MTRRPLPYLTLILGIVVALPLSALAGDLSKKAHTDLCVGFTFKPPAGWKGVPPESKYLGEGDITAGASSEARDVKICEYRDLKIGESVHIRVYYLGGTRGNLDRAETVFQIALSNWYNPDSYGQSKVVKVGRAPGKQFMAECGRGATIRGTVLAMDKRAIGIVERWYEKTPLAAIELMHKSVATMAIIPKGRMGSLRARYGKTVILSDWGTLKTRYYDIDYNTDKDFVKKLADHMQAMQGLYRKLFPTRQRDKFRIKVFANARGFHKYSMTPPGVVAYFSPGQGELCCYKTPEMREIKVDGGEVIKIGNRMPLDEVFRVMSHEGWHQFLSMYVGKNRFADLPMWFNEGMAEYFFAATLQKSGKLEIGLHSWRMPVIAKLVDKEKHVPLHTFLRMDRSAYYSNPSVCYAQGWSLCYFLLESGNKDYKAVPNKMMYWLKRTGNGERAMSQVFAKIDLEELEREWLVFTAKIEVPKEMLTRDR